MSTPVTLYVRNIDLRDYLGRERTYLTAPASAAATSLVVRDNHGFIDDAWIGIGEPGVERSEIKRIDASVSAGAALTVTALTFAHPVDTPIYRLPGDQVEFFRSDTPAGAKTSLGSAQAIDWDSEHSRFTDTTNESGYFWVRIYDSNTSAYVTDYLGGWDYSGAAPDNFAGAKYLALKREGETYSVKLTDEWLDLELRAYRAHMKEHMNIDLEIGHDESLSLESHVRRQAVPTGIKLPGGDKGVIAVRLGLHGRLEPLTWRQYLDKFNGVAHTVAASAASAGATSLVGSNSYQFQAPDAGSAALKVKGMNLTYGTNTKNTGTFSDIPASGDGAITEDIAAGDDVWQGVQDGLPTHYCVWNGYLYLYPIASPLYAGIPIEIDHWKDDSTALVETEKMDVAQELAVVWLQWRIKEQKKDKDWKDKRQEFFTLRNETFGLSRPNLETGLSAGNPIQHYTA